jgi:hypothetical protein
MRNRQKVPRNSWTSSVCCTVSSCLLYKILLIISTSKFSSSYAIQFGGRGATSGKEKCFCITITPLDIHRLLCRNLSRRKAFLSSHYHHTHRISLRVTSGYSLLWKWVSLFNHGGHQNESDGRTPENSKRSLTPVFPSRVEQMEQVCVSVYIQGV